MERTEIAARVCRALQDGTLTEADLSARRLSAWLGKTTSLLYHHFGSFDAFLYEVAQHGMERMAEQMPPDGDLEAHAEAFVRFACAHPALYRLMFQHPFDYAALKQQRDLTQSRGLRLWRALVMRVARAGARDPSTDARVLYAGLHGLASLALTGRANVGDIEQTDLDIALRSARRLVELIRERP